MMIAAANSKGGVGKTTLSVHLAAWLELHGWEVMLVDCDAQRLSSRWLKYAAPKLPTLVLDTPKRIDAELKKLKTAFEAVVVDAPGGLGESAGAILSHSDAVFVPTGPSNLDILGLEWTTATLHQIQKLRGGKPLAVVVPVRATANRATTKHLMEKAGSYGFGITKSTLPFREIYAKVAGLGDVPPKLLWQLGKSRPVRQAALEMDALFREVFPEACEKNPYLVRELVSPVNKMRSNRNVEHNQAA